MSELSTSFKLSLNSWVEGWKIEGISNTLLKFNFNFKIGTKNIIKQITNN